LGCALHRGDQHILHYGSGPGYAARGTCRCYLTCISAQGARLDGRTYGNMTRRGWLCRAGYPRAPFRISRRRKACFCGEANAKRRARGPLGRYARVSLRSAFAI